MYIEPEEIVVLPPNLLFIPYRRVTTLREIWSQKYISPPNFASSRPLPSIPAGIRGFEEITLIRGENFYAQSRSLLYLFYLMIERMRRGKGDGAEGIASTISHRRNERVAARSDGLPPENWSADPITSDQVGCR